MVFRKCLAILLILSMVLGAIPALAEYNKPYYIEVDVTNQIVTIYNTADDSIARQMLCSTGAVGHETIEGVFYLPETDRSDERSEWYSFYALGVYAMWATRIKGNYLFHSIPCYSKNVEDVVPRYVREFGMQASHGCVRLQVEDAEFIAKNCLKGTRVNIYRSGELQEDLRQLLYISAYTGEDGMTYQEFLGISENDLGRGSTGTQVLDLQYRLADLGYYEGEMSGNYDTATIAAVKNLQNDLGVSDTGIASASLLEVIYSDNAPVSSGLTTIAEGRSGPAVKKLQLALQSMGLYSGELDSIMDLEVTEALEKFQSACGYSVDGVATAEVQQTIYYQLGELEEVFGDAIPEVELVTEEIVRAKLDSSANIIIRSKPDTDSDRLGKITSGAIMTVLGVDGKWANISYNGVVGYIQKKYLGDTATQYNYILQYTGTNGEVYRIGHTLEEYAQGVSSVADEMEDVLASESFTAEIHQETVEYVTVNTGADNVNLNLRATADSSGEILTEVPNGTSLRVVGTEGDWTRVGYDNHIGYLMNDYLTFWEGSADALSASVTLDSVDDVDGALQSMGGKAYATVVNPEGSDENRKLRPYLYAEPSLKADKYTTMPEGVEVEIVEYIEDEENELNWLKVNYLGQTGYMRDICLQFELEGA